MKTPRTELLRRVVDLLLAGNTFGQVARTLETQESTVEKVYWRYIIGKRCEELEEAFDKKFDEYLEQKARGLRDEIIATRAEMAALKEFLAVEGLTEQTNMLRENDRLVKENANLKSIIESRFGPLEDLK